MKTNIIAVAGIGILVLFVVGFASIFEIRLASAQVYASSTPPISTDSSTTPPAGLTLVHIIGTKYTDYFTDGTTTFAFRGDPAIDSHFSEPNAPIPTHEGLTWVHTTGGYLYDTPSGDLEVGDYAVQSNGSYITNAPPSTFI